MSHYEDWRPKFAEAMDSRLFTIQWLDELVSQGKVQFFASDNAAIVAELRQYPTGARAVQGLYAAGELSEIVDILIPMAEEWGRSNGCKYAFIESREAWERILKGSGYVMYKIAVGKVL